MHGLHRLLLRGALAAASLLGIGCADSLGCGTEACQAPDEIAETLFVASEADLASFDASTGEERPGLVQGVHAAAELFVTEDGFAIVHSTASSEVVVVDVLTMLEEARLPSSTLGGEQPVHGYFAPHTEGRELYVVFNDGDGADPSTSTASFLDVGADSDRRFEIVGEVRLGTGHHKASFSTTRDRFVVGSLEDCDDVLTVYDYSDLGAIAAVATLTARDAGWTAPEPDEGWDPHHCDPTQRTGVAPAPHGCATSIVSGEAYCNLAGSGDVVVVDIDADQPTFELVPTTGRGGGFTLAHPRAGYVYTLQDRPREGDGGAPCQVGQLTVTDTATGSVVVAVPIHYDGPDCTASLIGTQKEQVAADRAHFASDKLFVPLAAGTLEEVEPKTRHGGVDHDVISDRVVVVDLTDPRAPLQLPSVAVGRHNGHSAAALSGRGTGLFVAGSVDGVVSEIDVATLEVVRTLWVRRPPHVVATFGTEEGPSSAP